MTREQLIEQNLRERRLWGPAVQRFGDRLPAILGRSRVEHVVRARHAFWEWLIYDVGLSQNAAAALCHVDHTTVRAAMLLRRPVTGHRIGLTEENGRTVLSVDTATQRVLLHLLRLRAPFGATHGDLEVRVYEVEE